MSSDKPLMFNGVPPMPALNALRKLVEEAQDRLQSEEDPARRVELRWIRDDLVRHFEAACLFEAGHDS